MPAKEEQVSGAKVARKDPMQHVVPKWFAWVDSTIALTGLLLMEIFVAWLFLMSNGWVRDITNPGGWTLIQRIGACVFLLGATAFAGITVMGSYACARAFATQHGMRGFFILIGMIVFTSVEIFAGISERSISADPSPADHAIATALGLGNAQVPLGVILAGVMLPVATFYRGFVAVKREEEDDDTRHKRMQREQELAEHKRRMREIGAGGLGAALRAGIQAAKGGDAQGSLEQQTDLASSASGIGEPAPPSRPLGAKRAGASGANGAPAGIWIWSDLQQYVRAKYELELTEEAAKEHMRSVPTRVRLGDGVTGRPYGAPRADVKRWADGRFATKVVAQMAAEQAV